MNRAPLSVLAAVTALAAITGIAALTAPDDRTDGAGTRAPTRLPVERSSLLCPSVGPSEGAGTTYTSFTPAAREQADGTAGDPPAGRTGTAGLRPADGPLPAPEGNRKRGGGEEDRTGGGPVPDGTRTDGGPPPAAPVLTLDTPGTPVSARATTGGDAPALVGTATAALAPGWTTQQTTLVPTGTGRGLLGAVCTAPGTDFWFPGASTAKNRPDYLHLINPDDSPAVADVEIHGRDGRIRVDLPNGVPVPPGAGIPLLLSALTTEELPDATVRVTTRSGRVGAVVRTAEDGVGADWLAASAAPSPTVVLPGIPADATSVRLTLFAPGDSDAELRAGLAVPGGTFGLVGRETVRVEAGTTTVVELGDLTRGEPGSLVLRPARPDRATPVVAALRIVRGTGRNRETAQIPATGPVGERASAVDNRATGTTLSLTAPDRAARVRVTVSTGTKGGTPAVREYRIAAGTTTAVTPPVPAGLKGSYALTVRTLPGGGPVHAARTLALPRGGVAMFTVQTLPGDRGTVSVPAAARDLTVLDD
ncbi:DUF5719 family protein [Streptomyces sp. NPDC020875]|uniref:DUF5719 family protein n=1 Tax=Streptomyces sp. NPDC020875 TaxID=3154898 RepID=UPI0033FB2897